MNWSGCQGNDLSDTMSWQGVICNMQRKSWKCDVSFSNLVKFPLFFWSKFQFFKKSGEKHTHFPFKSRKIQRNISQNSSFPSILGKMQREYWQFQQQNSKSQLKFRQFPRIFCKKLHFLRNDLLFFSALLCAITKNLMFEKCEFCEKWYFKIVNFVKNEILKMWILWKMRF